MHRRGHETSSRVSKRGKTGESFLNTPIALLPQSTVRANRAAIHTRYRVFEPSVTLGNEGGTTRIKARPFHRDGLFLFIFKCREGKLTHDSIDISRWGRQRV